MNQRKGHHLTRTIGAGAKMTMLIEDVSKFIIQYSEVRIDSIQVANKGLKGAVYAYEKHQLKYFYTGVGDKSFGVTQSIDSVDSFYINLKVKKSVEGLRKEFVTAGIGLGFDFGVMGTNLLVFPQKNIGLFGSLGYNFVDLGFNFGVKIRAHLPNEFIRVDPFIIGMYGYYAAINILNAQDLNKIFYGTTVGAGIDYYFKSTNKMYMSFALLIPIRGSEVQEYITFLQTHYNIQMNNSLSPVGLSFGLHFILD